MKTIINISVVIIYFVVSCRSQRSPCPTIFQYQFDNNNRLFGIIQVSSPKEREVRLFVELSVGAKIEGYNGKVELAYSRNEAANNVLSGKRLQYHLHFPPVDNNVPPQVTKIQVNERIICSGPPVDSTSVRVITTIKLQHLLTIKIPDGGLNYSLPNAYEPETVNNIYTPSSNNYNPPFNSPNSGLTTVDVAAIFAQSEDSKPSYTTTTRRPIIQNINFNPQRPDPASLFNEDESPPVIPKPVQKPTERPVTSPPVHRPIQRPEQRPSESSNNLPNIPFKNICGMSVSTNPLVVYGEKTSKGEFPWLAAMFYQQNRVTEYRCAGTLISKEHIVTAAHCCKQRGKRVKAQHFLMVLGKYNIDSWSTEEGSLSIEASEIKIHPEYETSSADADIAIVVLSETVEFTHSIRPICLWSGENELNRIVGSSGTVVGWGKNEKDQISTSEPAQISLPIASQQDCLESTELFSFIISNRTFCAGLRNGRGPCNGDSGSGFIMRHSGRWTLRGIVSLSLSKMRQCDLSQYIVFVDATKFHKWIYGFLTESDIY